MVGIFQSLSAIILAISVMNRRLQYSYTDSKILLNTNVKFGTIKIIVKGGPHCPPSHCLYFTECEADRCIVEVLVSRETVA